MSELTTARRRALHWLGRREHSQFEIQQKLLSKGYSPEIAADVVQYLLEHNYLDDQRFCESYVRWRRNRGLGPIRIQQALLALGIDAEMIAQQLEITDNAWFIAAHQVWEKQFKGKLPKTFPERAKQMRFLQYRGFTREQITFACSAKDLATEHDV